MTTRRSITVSWKTPKHDGGSEITGYHLEYQILGSTIWEKVSNSTTLLSHIVKNLEYRKQYRFRVFAKNIVGLSEPLNGDLATAKDPFGKKSVVFKIFRCSWTSFNSRNYRL